MLLIVNKSELRSARKGSLMRALNMKDQLLQTYIILVMSFYTQL